MADEEKEGKSGGLNPKVLLIGIPLYIVQLVAVYFVTVNFFIDAKHPEDGTEVVNEDELAFADSVVTGKFIFQTGDIIVNPADGGVRLMLINLGFDVPKEEMLTELQEKKPIVNDALITLIGKKRLRELMNVKMKPKLKEEIKEMMKKKFPEIKITEIYYNKYIIQ
jgi:flagellar FliL protein